MAVAIPNRQALWLGAGLLASALVSVLWVLLAYQVGIVVALVLPFGLAIAAVIAYNPLAGVCLAFLAAPVDYLAASGGASFSITPSEAVLFITALSTAPRLAKSLTAARVPNAFYAYAGLIVISVAGLFVAVETFTVMRIVIDWVAFGLVGLYVSQLSLRSAKMVAICMSISGGILGLTAIGTLSKQKAQAGGAIIANRAEGSFAHPTSLALFLILTFPVAFAFALNGPRRLRAPMMICAVAAMTGLIATQTRGSFIGAGFALIYMMWKWQAFRRFAAAAILVLALAGLFNIGSVFGGGQTASVVGDRLSSLSLNGEGDQRLEIWATVPRIIVSHPVLGIGQGNFPAVSPRYGLRDVSGVAFDHAHDIFLNIAVELGLPALVLFLCLLGFIGGAIYRATRDRASPVYPFAVAVSASLIALIVNSITEYPLRQNLILATILVVIGLLYAFERGMREERASLS
jgi:hypothetical protein